MTKIAIEFTLEKMPKVQLLKLRHLLGELHENNAADQCLKVFLQGDVVTDLNSILKGPKKL